LDHFWIHFGSHFGIIFGPFLDPFGTHFGQGFGGFPGSNSKIVPGRSQQAFLDHFWMHEGPRAPPRAPQSDPKRPRRRRDSAAPLSDPSIHGMISVCRCLPLSAFVFVCLFVSAAATAARQRRTALRPAYTQDDAFVHVWLG